MRGWLIFWGIIGTIAGAIGIEAPGLFRPYAVPVMIISGFAVTVGVATCDVVDAIERKAAERGKGEGP